MLDYTANVYEFERLLGSYRYLNKTLLLFNFELILDKANNLIIIEPVNDSSDIIQMNQKNGNNKKLCQYFENTEKLKLYNAAINRMDYLFKKLEKELLEALFWRYIDNSRKNNKIPSDRSGE